jgi:aspartyl-tRNA(Asn)/glutamyl-tRNA(Gln) amidotransferase subunit C
MTFDTKKIARLSRIALTEEDAKALEPKLDNIMKMLDQLQQVDTNEIHPMVNPLEQMQRTREDIATESDQHQKYQSIAPLVAAGLYLVPKVID